MRCRALSLLFAAGLLACLGCGSLARSDAPERWLLGPGAAGPRVLVVTAHPDDESVFAGTLYKVATHLGGTWDLFVVTNGEGGFKYATLAEQLYGLELTDEAVGREWLPDIRAAELAEAAFYLGAHELVMLRETDHRYTQDESEVLGEGAGVWDLERIRRLLRRQLERDYDFVLVLAPTASTHGHHKAVTLLALEAVAELPEVSRPVPMCATLATEDDPHPHAPPMLGGWQTTAIREVAQPLVFDRTQAFGHRGQLDYRIVADWAIAAHKSQGTMQTYMRRGLAEHYWIFDIAAPEAEASAARLFERLAEPQFVERTYGTSAGTNATSR